MTCPGSLLGNAWSGTCDLLIASPALHYTDPQFNSGASEVTTVQSYRHTSIIITSAKEVMFSSTLVS